MRIFLFRGLFGFLFSTGINKLAVKLNREGHTASVHSWYSRRTVFNAARKTNGPIGIVGHSLGGNAANYVSNDLLAVGKNIRGVVCIDATAPEDMPPGTPGFDFISRDFRARDVKGLKTIKRDDLTHTQIDKDAKVHGIILKLFREG